MKSYKNICVDNWKTKSVKYLPINDTSKTHRQVLITGPWRHGETDGSAKYFRISRGDIYNVTMSIVPVTSSDAGLITRAPQDNVSELTLLATIIFLSFLHPFVKNKGNEKK